MTHLTDQDKAELLEDARSASRQMEFAGMNVRSKKLNPVEWLDFLTRFSRLGLKNTANQTLIKGNRFKL